MDIVICNYLSGSFLLEREPHAWDAIVILDSGMSHTDFVAQHAVRHLYLRFDDVNTDVRGKRTPASNDIQSALNFAEQSENLFVCRAGQSRSAATAFVICHRQLGSHAACRLLNPKRHVPNALIVNIGARLIDDPGVLETFNKWCDDHKHITLSDHVDDIEREVDELERQGARDRIVAS